MFVKLHHSQINIDLSTLASGTMTSGAQLSKISVTVRLRIFMNIATMFDISGRVWQLKKENNWPESNEVDDVNKASETVCA
jgi:hypothetical protein